MTAILESVIAKENSNKYKMVNKNKKSKNN